MEKKKIDLRRKEDLTVEELKSFPGLESLNDDEANHIIESLKELSLLICYAADKMQYNKTKSIDNQRNMIIFAGTKTA